MKNKPAIPNFKNLYSKVMENKLITICILFTIITVLESLMIVLGVIQPKVDLGPYIHMLGRFVLNSTIIGSLYIFEILKKLVNNKLIIYIATYLITLSFTLLYVFMNSFFSELHPDAYMDVSISYTFMYTLLGIVFFIGSKTSQKNKNKSS